MTAAKMPDRTGTAAGVPFIAFAPSHSHAGTPLVVILHLMDAPNSERAMAAALPLDGLDAWKAYLGLPMHGERAPAGEEEMERIAQGDWFLNWDWRVMTEAAAELPGAIAALREQLSVPRAPLALVGGSAGGTAVLLALTDPDVEADAAAVINPVVRAATVVDEMERMNDFTYEWTEAAHAMADRLDLVQRARALARPPLLIMNGADDPMAGLRADAQELATALRNKYADPSQVETVVIPSLRHALAEEPGNEPQPQTEGAKQVDAAVVAWLKRWLPR